MAWVWVAAAMAWRQACPGTPDAVAISASAGLGSPLASPPRMSAIMRKRRIPKRFGQNA
jgi:hypothetical protein